MTQFFIDSDNGSDANDGLTTGNSFLTLNKFTETARSAGDIVTIRRGRTATIDDGGQLEFTSDGIRENPIVLEADYDDDFSDDVTTAGETYTTVFGAKTITGSGTIDAAIVAGAWVYVSTDNQRKFAYEVASVTSTVITLFLPFKGTTGSGLTLKVMESSPIWGATTAFSFSIRNSADDFWIYRGISFKTSAGSLATPSGFIGWISEDCTYSAIAGTFILNGDAYSSTYFNKTRFFGYETISGQRSGITNIHKDCLLDGNSLANSKSSFQLTGSQLQYIDCEFKNHATADIDLAVEKGSRYRFRNCKFDSTTEFANVGDSTSQDSILLIEDYDGTVSDSVQHSSQSVSDTSFLFQSDLSNLRTGGNNISIKVTPNTNIGVEDFARVLLFEYPIIYSTAVAKTFTVFFKSADISEWTASPTADQLYLEIESWQHATNNFRGLTRSTGAVDFLTDTDFDQSLDVSATPAQVGLAYLRLYLAKPKESGKNNIFFVDPKVVIS